MDQKAMKNAGVALVLVILFSVTFVSLPTQRVMATMTISISPQSGVVEDTVRMNGTIDTLDGNFTVRWNQELNITTGQATGFNVATSFNIPQTVGALTGSNVTIELIDDATSGITSENFTLYTRFYMKVITLPPPKQIMEGLSAFISINVTGGERNTIYTANLTVKDPANQTQWKVLPLSNTTTNGVGWVGVPYPSTEFGAGGHTNYTGKYVVTFNQTISDEFFVGLTEKSEYRRGEILQIRAAGYSPSEVTRVDIKTGGLSVATFPKNWTARSDGVVLATWDVPVNATSGIYRVTVTNTTAGGTVKPVKDAQDFRILGVACQVQTKNLAGERVADVTVEVYNTTNPSMTLMEGNTNSTGWMQFNLNTGNYTFKAFVKNVEVGRLSNQSITVDSVFNLQLRLVNVVATVETKSGERVPFVDVALKYNYTTRDNRTISETASMLTNLTGMAETHNLFTNTTYRVEAKRNGVLFSNTTLTIEFSPPSPWRSLDLTLPSYALNVHVLDSEGSNASGILIRVYEWAAGVTVPYQYQETSSSGDASFLLPFGRYRLRAYKGGVFLNETVVNLIENPLAFTLNLITANIDVTVSTLDYFGQPIANAEVKIEREIDQENVLVDSQFTGGDGSVRFTLSVGGDSRISVFVFGRLVAVNTQFLDGGPNQVTFRIGEYVTISGYPIETGAFTLVSFIIALVVIFIVAMRRRFTQVFRKRRKG